MPSTDLNILSALKQYALDEIENKQRDLKTEKSDFESHFGPQDAKPKEKLLYFERQEFAVKDALRILSQFVGNPDGTFSCPSCFLRGKNNLLAHDIHYGDGSAFHCDVCDALIHVQT